VIWPDVDEDRLTKDLARARRGLRFPTCPRARHAELPHDGRTSTAGAHLFPTAPFPPTAFNSTARPGSCAALRALELARRAGSLGATQRILR